MRPFRYWLLPAVLFLIFLGFFDASCTLLLSLTLHNSTPSFEDALLFAGAPAIYALFGIPAAVFLYLSERALIYAHRRLNVPAHVSRPMDVMLMLAWVLLTIKLIATALPYLINADHLPTYPYLTLIPVIVFYCCSLKYTGGNMAAYRAQWVAACLAAVFLSRGAYELFVVSSRGLPVKTAALIVFAGAASIVGVTLSTVFARLFSRRSPAQPAAACLLLAVSAIGCFFLASAASFESALQDIPDHGRELPTTARPLSDRNAIVVVVDCLRADHLASYGYNKTTSPFIDSIADSDIKVTTCIAPSSWTLPSVASLFTGVYPQQHGVNTFGTVIPAELESMHSIMDRNGIVTAAFVTNDYLKLEHGFGRGFRHYFDAYIKPDLQDHLVGNLFFLNAAYYIKNEILHPKAVDPGAAKWWSIGMPPFNHSKISAEQVIDDVVTWLMRNRQQPFYVYIHLMDAHSPYDTYWYPLFDKDSYEKQTTPERLANTYDGRIMYVDRQIQRLWEKLTELQLAKNTMLMVTSDHGEEMYDHGGTGHCTTLYEELIRVPLVIRAHDLAQQPVNIRRPVSSLSVPVTVLDYLQLQIPEHMKGESLLPLLNRPDEDPGGRVYTISHTTRGRKSLTTEEGRKLFFEKRAWDQKIVLESLRLGDQWKIIIGDDGRRQLFNLHRDPRELHPIPLSEQHPMMDMLLEKLSEISSRMKTFIPESKTDQISPEMNRRLKALGYMS